jgi:hypothetical protein
MRTETVMLADKLYEIVREAVHAKKSVLFYVPWPFYRGWVNINVKEAMVLLRGRGDEMVVDIDETEHHLRIHAGEHPPLLD